ncbi:MAG: hypothetical protein EOM26_10840 [Alphaproteobacteria bacterium]|nr:hypothetical protein [Alphaproteobacteria bacterium]
MSALYQTAIDSMGTLFRERLLDLDRPVFLVDETFPVDPLYDAERDQYEGFTRVSLAAGPNDPPVNRSPVFVLGEEQFADSCRDYCSKIDALGDRSAAQRLRTTFGDHNVTVANRLLDARPVSREALSVEAATPGLKRQVIVAVLEDHAPA